MGSTVAGALAAARAAAVDRLDAQLLLAQLLGRPRAWLLAHDDAALDDATAAAFQAGIARRAAGEPLAYVTGHAVFRGLDLHVSPAVLIPRPETEVLVDWALECWPGAGAAVDLGTGSGAIALALARELPRAAVVATDRSADALAVARGNGARLAVGVEWLAGDWWQPLAGRRFALAVCNPPYVAGGDPHLVALSHEPAAALTPGGDGLAALRSVVQGAAAHLLPGAWLLLEHGHDQADAVCSMLQAAGFEAAQTRADLAALPRCSGGRRPVAK